MSVIQYVSEEEKEETIGIEKEEDMQSNEPISMQPPKLRVAVCGPAKSGKTFLLNSIEQSYLQRFENPLRHYMHMNKSLGPSNFEFTTDICAVQTRDYLSICGLETGKEEYFRTCLDELNDHDLILVEDVRHPWEYEVLKSYGFLIIYMDTPDDVRHKRSTDLTERNFMWTEHEICLSKLHWSDHDSAYVELTDELSYCLQFDITVDHGAPIDQSFWDKMMHFNIKSEL